MMVCTQLGGVGSAGVPLPSSEGSMQVRNTADFLTLPSTSPRTSARPQPAFAVSSLVTRQLISPPCTVTFGR